MKVINIHNFRTHNEFMTFCLYPEILHNLNEIDFVYRHAEHSISKFRNIYEHVMKNINIELSHEDFKNANLNSITIFNESFHLDNINIFQNYIRKRYNLCSNINKIKTIFVIPSNIKNVNEFKEEINRRYALNVDIFMLDNTHIEKQIQYFHNATTIILLNHDIITNLLFCNIGATVIDMCDDKIPNYIKDIMNSLRLKYYKVLG